MSETLLAATNLLLFGQKVADLQLTELAAILPENVKAASAKFIKTSDLAGDSLDEVKLVKDDPILLKDLNPKKDNGIYKVGASPDFKWGKVESVYKFGMVINVGPGDGENADTRWGLEAKGPIGANTPLTFIPFESDRGFSNRRGINRQLEEQMNGAGFARIYGFSYEGRYYDLARPALFMVHGDGEPASLPGKLSGKGGKKDEDNPHLARAPLQASETGLAASDFQFAEALRVWSYDKADYTIRMDVETGMFEQVLLDAELDEDAIATFSGGQRARVSGQRARVSGQRARVSGQRARASDRGD